MTTRGSASFNPAVEAVHAGKKLPQKKLQRKEIPQQCKDVREERSKSEFPGRKSRLHGPVDPLWKIVTIRERSIQNSIQP